jgi:hypothetical protein
MKKITLLTLATLGLFLCGEALALKSRTNLAPENLKQEGFAVATSKRDDGTIDVTLTRDLSKARSFDASSDIELVRRATLVVAGPAGTIVRCDLEPDAAEGNVIYHFTLAPGYLADSRITVSEIDDYKKSLKREHLIGGGTYFEIKLADVAKP